MNYEKKQEKNILIFNIIVEASEFDKYYNETLNRAAKEIEVDGFRKGHVPLSIAKPHINFSHVLSYAAEDCISAKWFEIMNKENIEAIKEPSIEVLKMAEGNPLEFKAEVEILPEIKLPDYKKIAKETPKEEIKVEEKNYNEALNWLIQSRAKFFEKNGKAEKGDLVEITYNSKDIDEGKEKKDRFILGKGYYIQGLEDNLIGLSKGDKKEIKAEDPKDKKKKIVISVRIDSIQKMEIPELNEDFAKEAGFESIKKLEENIRKGLNEEKELAEKQRRRAEILKKIAKETKVEVPETLIQRESEALFQNLKNRVSYELQITFEDYLKQIKKTEEEIRKEFEKAAKERVKSFLMLYKIEKEEKISITEEELEKKIEELAAEYPDKDKARQEMKNSNTRSYIKDELKISKIFNILGC